MAPLTAYWLLVVFAATLVRSTFGFGEALFAVPLLALFLPLAIVAPVVVLISITIAALAVIQDWRHIHLRSAAWLLAPTFFGIGLGIACLASPHPAAMKLTLALAILAYAVYYLFAAKPLHLTRDHRGWLLGCGLLAGVLGGAFGMNGPPLVMYGSMRRWSPQHLRATLQAYFLPAGTVTLAGYWMAGLWTRAVTYDYLVCLPVVLPAILLGRVANRRLRGPVFLRAVHIGLAAIGALLFIQALRSAIPLR